MAVGFIGAYHRAVQRARRRRAEKAAQKLVLDPRVHSCRSDGTFIGNIYTDDPHVADAALRADHMVRSTVAVPRPVDRRRLEMCVVRWRALAECYQSDVRGAILECAEDLQRTLAETPVHVAEKSTIKSE